MRLLALLAAATALLPLVGVVIAALSGPGADIAARDVARYALTSAVLAALVALVTAVVGSVAAWLVVMHRFPGRGVFAWALALPLAAPAFALAYAYADLLDVAGPLRFWMRDALGFDLAIQMRSVPGAVLVLGCAFYPYVYLAMRAALVNQSVSAVEAARMLGASPARAVWRVAVPLARPALAAGVALAVMETLADYGAVQFLAVQTLTTGVVRAWSVYGSTASAAQFALPLMATAAVLLWLERWGRKGRGFETTGARWRPLPVTDLKGWRAALATGFCVLLLTVALILPMGWLLVSSIDVRPEWPRLIEAGRNTLLMGVTGAVVTVALATLLALGADKLPVTARVAGLGYATPGAVMAIGLLLPAGLVWSLIPGATTGLGAGVILLIYAYAARLMAAAVEPIEAGLAKVTPSMVRSARALGRSELGAAWAVRLPLARGALLTAGLIVLVDVLKELPATLILRPFNFDTLAVMASNYALDERLPQAGWPSLIIVGLALPGVIWLTRRVAASRPGSDA
ncbi:ABC transporter permease [Brevundimonas lutea]|uniref:ABC transporter permease n=1 Tax=Brevundimonas lutea TaxID=2293980 RepID=UPI000F0194C4|nr:ABC transporter permease subunit [Brevundimonas lutea]